jgi:membrane-associated phospholipid phosphatase
MADTPQQDTSTSTTEPESVPSTRRYALKGLQVEPTAGLWIDGTTRICVPDIGQVQKISEATPTKDNSRLALDFAQDFPDDTDLKEQLEVLRALAANRMQPYPSQVFTSTAQAFRLTPLSQFLQLQPFPFGAIVNIARTPQEPITNVLEQHRRITTTLRVVQTGRELARLFESETPGLYHRHALNWALFNRADISPPRHARMWMALDVAICAALDAAWFYKWLRPTYSRLLRPVEYALRNHESFDVLFDRTVSPVGEEGGETRDCPVPSPGTPRHPSWPSGHSTFSAAASHLLEYFFSPDTLALDDQTLFGMFPPGSIAFDQPGSIAAELRRLANNIGEARLWGGVHWLSDHVAGQKIGRSAAQAVIKQLRDDCVPVLPVPLPECNSTGVPPDNAEIRTQAGRGGSCASNNHDFIPQPKDRGEAHRKIHQTF